LLTIITVADCHSITHAATLLYTSRQNVSKTIAKLEKNLKVILFQRMHDGVYLTEKGQLVYDYAVQVRTLQERLKQQLYPQTTSADLVFGDIQIVTIPHLVDGLTTFLSQFNQQYPAINVNISEISPNQIVTNLETGNHLQGDLFLFAQNTELNIIPTNNQFHLLLLEKQPLVLYAHKNSSIASLKQISVDALKNINLVVYSPSANLEFMAFSKDPLLKNLKPNIKFHSNNLNICKNYVLQNKACLLGSSGTYTFSTETENIVKIPFKEELKMYNYMAVQKGEQPLHIQKFIEAFLASFKK